MTRPVLLRLASVLVISSALTVCSDAPTSVAESDVVVTVSLHAPAAPAIGAVRVRVSGSSLGGATSASSAYTLYWRAESDTAIHAIVLGPLAPGPLFTVSAHAGRHDVYSATILEAATTGNLPIESLGDFSAPVTVSR